MGGSRIISGVLQTIVNVIDHGMNIADASGQPRMHHQWYPDVLLLEPGFSPDTTRLLKERGHDVRLSRTGTVQIAAYKDGTFRGAADPRMPNSGAVAPAEIIATDE
jgi:gamma-glutamyltranspeptidase/glutathione hydrolase